VSSADQTLKTLLVLDCARQHTGFSMFHARRPTLVIVRLHSPGQRHGTDYQQQSGHLTSESSIIDGLFFSFSSHLECGRWWIGTPCYGP